jgi:hypothetical protein
VVTPRLPVRWNPEQSSQVCRETRRGAPATRHEPQAKTDPSPPETGAPVPGGGYPQELRNNSEQSPRNPRASSGRRPPATRATRDVPTRERRHSDRGGRRGRGQLAERRRPALGEGTPAEVLAGGASRASRSQRSQARHMRGPWWCWVRGTGLARTVPPPLFIIPIAPRSGHRFRAGTIAFAPPSGHRVRDAFRDQGRPWISARCSSRTWRRWYR